MKQETYSGSGSDNDDDTPEGDREVLAVIGGVRLMSMVRRGEMAAEIHRQVRRLGCGGYLCSVGHAVHTGTCHAPAERGDGVEMERTVRHWPVIRLRCRWSVCSSIGNGSMASTLAHGTHPGLLLSHWHLPTAQTHPQAQEDAEMEAEDRAREEADHRGERGGSAPSGEQPVAGAAADATAASRSSVGAGAGAESSKTQASSEPQREQRWVSEPEQQDADDGAKEDASPAAGAEREEDTPPVAPACVSKRPSGASAVSKSDSVGSAGSAAGAQSRVSCEDGSDGLDAPDGGEDAADKEEEEEEGEAAKEEEAGGDGEDDDGEDLGGVELPDEGAAAEDDAEEAEDNVELPDGADED